MTDNAPMPGTAKVIDLAHYRATRGQVTEPRIRPVPSPSLLRIRTPRDVAHRRRMLQHLMDQRARPV